MGTLNCVERFWINRLRWRLRGATQWPAFVVLTLLDGLVLDRLPPLGTTGFSFIPGVLIATFANLFLIGALAPFLARRLDRRAQAAPAVAGAAPPPEAEQEVRRDRLATVLLGIGLVACIVSGLANRPLIVSETKETEAAAVAVRDFVGHLDNKELDRNLETANTVRFGEGIFRTCIARDDRRSFYCLKVDTNTKPTRVTPDPSGEPNSVISGP